MDRLKTRFIYGTPNFALLANDPAMPIAREVGNILGKNVPENHGTFGNAEYRVIVDQPEVQTRDVYVFQTTDVHPNSNIRQAKLLAIGAKNAGAARINYICSNLAYSRQDRVIIPGEPDSGRNVVQEMWDAGSHNYRKRKHESQLRSDATLWVVDIHSVKPLEAVNRLSKHPYEWVNLNSDFILKPAIAHLIEEKGLNPVMAFPDETARLKYADYAKWFGKGLESAVTVKKIRQTDKKNQVAMAEDQEDFAPKVAGMDVIIRDDMFDTGGTAIQACKAFMEAGARSVRVVVTHGVLSRDPENPEKDAIYNINSPYLTELIILDTIPPTDEVLNHPKITVIKHAPLLAEAIQRVENREPLGELATSMSPGFERSYMRWTKVNKYRRRSAKQQRKIS